MNILKILTPNRITGNFGERAAEKHLKKNGYKILEKNFVALGNEIDIIAKNRDTLIFVEVKTRTVSEKNELESRPAAAVTREKQKKIIDTARWYIAAKEARGAFSHLQKRLDVIEVYVSNNGKFKLEKLVHMEGAFRIS